MSNDKLFNEFPPISTEAWEELIQKDLKGADYEKKLVWKTDEGFKVRPYYRADDLNSINYADTLPNEFPFVRGMKLHDNNWEVVQEVGESNPEAANKIAVHALQKGATMIAFNASRIATEADMELLLKDIYLDIAGVRFLHAPDYIALTNLFVNYLNKKGYDKAIIKGGIDFDPIVYSLKQGKYYRSQSEDFAQLTALYKMTEAMPLFKIVNVNGLALHNAGATTVQEVGYSIAMANEYMSYATTEGISIDAIVPKMEVTLSVGSNYFMEIAKLRAIRLLWATMVKQYNPQKEGTPQLHINSIASSWNKTLYDPYVNMLRTTTEGMSAAIGGTDTMSLQPFDTAYKADDEFSRRISRNVQVILKEESFLDKVADPAAGSYYIENLTDSVAASSWELFKEIENGGGICPLIASGSVKEEIEKSCRQRDMDIATRRKILLGTNQYPNVNEQMLDKIETIKEDDSPGLKSYRGAMAFERLRLDTEKQAKQNGRPRVFLLKVGSISMRQARAGFITNFFGCAGYEILDNAGFATADEGIKAAFEAKANIIVICSSDEEYATIGVEAAQKVKALNPNIPFVVAGNPTDCMEALKAAGADDFIHVRTNVLESLKGYNEKIKG